MSSANSYPQDSRIYADEEVEKLYEPEVVGDSKETASCKYSRADTPMNVQCLRKLRAKTVKDVEKRYPSITVAEIANWPSHSENQCRKSSIS